MRLCVTDSVRQRERERERVTLYVAMSRFHGADDVLILQPFSIDAFQEGVPDQPSFLLDYLSCDNDDEKTALIMRYEDNMARQQEIKRQEATASRSKQCKQKHAEGTLDGADDEAKKRKIDGLQQGRVIAIQNRAAMPAQLTCVCVECKQEKQRIDSI